MSQRSTFLARESEFHSIISAPAPAAPAGNGSIRAMWPRLIVNALLPFVTFQILSRAGWPEVQALSLVALFPVAAILFSWARTRHPDPIGMISVASIGLGIGATLISGDVHFVLIKDSLVTGLVGLVFLGSLLLPRPLMFHLSRRFATRGNPERAAWFDRLWERASFRRRQRILTTVWGVAYLAEATVRGVLVFVLPPAAVLAISPLLALGVTALLILGTLAYSRRAQTSPA